MRNKTQNTDVTSRGDSTASHGQSISPVHFAQTKKVCARENTDTTHSFTTWPSYTVSHMASPAMMRSAAADM